ncbi:hypothetical protein EUGRSUZ_D00544 [Eucalyptus grandis]|uniref:Uncharacterized protein n=2 Tax=Eucalyptus grandis TaxID=71139 RepID=A0ACC3L395_EUCGR|nr:hypothetical protein EUGRSUZ_D00544 [Eucalyptus grandis]
MTLGEDFLFDFSFFDMLYTFTWFMQSATGWETMPRILKLGESCFLVEIHQQGSKQKVSGSHISVRPTSHLR